MNIKVYGIEKKPNSYQFKVAFHKSEPIYVYGWQWFGNGKTGRMVNPSKHLGGFKYMATVKVHPRIRAMIRNKIKLAICKMEAECKNGYSG